MISRSQVVTCRRESAGVQRLRVSPHFVTITGWKENFDCQVRFTYLSDIVRSGLNQGVVQGEVE